MTTLVENLPSGGVVGGRLRLFRKVITLASQANPSTTALFRIPPGHTFVHGVITSSVTLGSSTAAIGIAGATTKYRAAATFTAADTPTLFGPAAALSAVTTGTTGSSPKGTGTDEDVILTVGGAALPSSGTLVIDIVTSAT
jgi:hypothetical protein